MTFGNDNILLIAIIVAALAAAIIAFLLYRSARRGRGRQPILSERAENERPYMRSAPPPPAIPQPLVTPVPVPAREAHTSVADEISQAATDVVGDVLNVDCDAPDGARDDLQKLKGCGPKLAARLNELGITSYAQLAGMGANEIAMLDERLGPFRGRIARDRFAEQAAYLARGDKDGFEEKFGKLGG